eukprot:TRINITY_DN111073_c0_g1_i1.p1 TRINITY_DN111073_c0_g1~~TRINITY_DN111073_c0_g1_i1.p1  ORF type:complete len:323 (+),score=34.20 TRINITY_DN111073_c0_g1_i1:178-1146(+)
MTDVMVFDEPLDQGSFRPLLATVCAIVAMTTVVIFRRPPVSVNMPFERRLGVSKRGPPIGSDHRRSSSQGSVTLVELEEGRCSAVRGRSPSERQDGYHAYPGYQPPGPPSPVHYEARIFMTTEDSGGSHAGSSREESPFIENSEQLMRARTVSETPLMVSANGGLSRASSLPTMAPSSDQDDSNQDAESESSKETSHDRGAACSGLTRQASASSAMCRRQRRRRPRRREGASIEAALIAECMPPNSEAAEGAEDRAIAKRWRNWRGSGDEVVGVDDASQRRRENLSWRLWFQAMSRSDIAAVTQALETERRGRRNSKVGHML